MIKLSICLSDIPKEKISKSTKNGKSYLDVIVDEKREPDTYGNTHTVYINQSKEDRAAQVKKTYIGSGKEYVFNRAAQPVQQNTQPQADNSNIKDDGLPF